MLFASALQLAAGGRAGAPLPSDPRRKKTTNTTAPTRTKNKRTVNLENPHLGSEATTEATIEHEKAPAGKGKELRSVLGPQGMPLPALVAGPLIDDVLLLTTSSKY